MERQLIDTVLFLLGLLLAFLVVWLIVLGGLWVILSFNGYQIHEAADCLVSH